ncbi:MAG: flavin reductase family protein [Myxococcota bacterium]
MRVPVELRKAYKLINHGPTTLITSAHAGKVNIMAAAWVMALDFDPPKLCAVIAGDTHTRGLVDASGAFVVNVPTRAQVDLTYAVGSESGRDVEKLSTRGIATAPAATVEAPLVEGCAAWLECKVVREPHNEKQYDLFIAQVTAAWAEDRLFRNGEWHFERDEDRTLHHMAKGVFYMTGGRVEVSRRR